MVGVSMSDPNGPSWAKPVSSSSTTTTLGAPAGLGTGGNHGTESAGVRPMIGPSFVVIALPSTCFTKVKQLAGPCSAQHVGCPMVAADPVDQEGRARRMVDPQRQDLLVGVRRIPALRVRPVGELDDDHGARIGAFER